MLAPILLAATLLRGPDPEFLTPRAAGVEIIRDTVWFRANEWPTGTPVSSCYVASSRSWCPVIRSPFPAAKAPALSARNARLLKLAQRASDAVPSAWLLDKGTLWAAFPGLSSEGEERKGVLAAIDTATRKIVRYRHASIDYTSITEIVSNGRTLWLGSVTEGEYGTYGGNGLIRVDLTGPTPRFSQNQQRSEVARTSEVWKVAASNDLIAVMTHAGLGVRSADGKWDWRYWNLGLQGDLIGHSLGATPVFNNDWPLLLALTHIRLTRPAPIVRAFKQRGWGIDNPDWLPTDSIAQLLVSAGANAIIRETLARPDSASSIVIAAAGYSRDQSLIPILKRRLAANTVGESEETALALLRLGDPAGLAWFRKQLIESQSATFTSPQLSEAVARSKRPEFVTLIVSFFERGIMPEGAMIVQDGRPVALPYYSAVEMLRTLDEMDSSDSRNAANSIRRRFPQLAR